VDIEEGDLTALSFCQRRLLGPNPPFPGPMANPFVENAPAPHPRPNPLSGRSRALPLALDDTPPVRGPSRDLHRSHGTH